MEPSKVLAVFGSMLDSQLFWGVVTLVLAAFAFSPKVSMSASNLLLVGAWFVGCFGIYRVGLFSDWYYMVISWLCFGTVLTFLASWINPGLPIHEDNESFISKALPEQVSSTITLTTRFVPMVFFPFTIPPNTTSYAILARLKDDVKWGAYEIRNDGSESLIWPELRALKWEIVMPEKDRDSGFPGLPDMAIALDLTNHSNGDLINFTAEIGYEFLEAIQEGTAMRSGAAVAKRVHNINIPVIKQNSVVRLHIGNQSSKYFVTVSFPTKATALLSTETKRRPINLVQTVVNRLEALPLFSLVPSKVRWINIQDD